METTCKPIRGKREDAHFVDFHKISRMLPDFDFSACYVKDNTEFRGRDTFKTGHVTSMEDCRTLCRAKNIENFVWVRTNWCVCKQTVTSESSNTCCVSGHAATCMGNNFTTGK